MNHEQVCDAILGLLDRANEGSEDPLDEEATAESLEACVTSDPRFQAWVAHAHNAPIPVSIVDVIQAVADAEDRALASDSAAVVEWKLATSRLLSSVNDSLLDRGASIPPSRLGEAIAYVDDASSRIDAAVGLNEARYLWKEVATKFPKVWIDHYDRVMSDARGSSDQRAVRMERLWNASKRDDRRWAAAVLSSARRPPDARAGALRPGLPVTSNALRLGHQSEVPVGLGGASQQLAPMDSARRPGQL